MAARLAALLPRLAALTLVWLLATSTITFAAAGRSNQDQTPEPASPPPGPKILLVPDVGRQAYVFAKGILDDGGFAWRVEGDVAGYAANLVAEQDPKPGVRVVDTGAPTIVLRLERNPDYDERGLPENSSPRKGTEIVLASEATAPPAPAAPPGGEPAGPEPKAPEEPGDGSEPGTTPDPAPATREPDFEVPGAPPEPGDEMPLPDRARLLERRMEAQARPTDALVEYWLYQHNWVVTGALFGWHDGAEALRIVLRVDQDLEARWGIGAKSAAVARAALAEVESKAR